MAEEGSEQISPRGLSKYQIADAKDAFAIFDKDKDGKISEKEIATVMRSLGQNPSKQEITDLIASVDKDENGLITFDEFLVLFEKQISEGDSEETIIDAFRTFDQGQVGKIPATELIHILKSLGDPMSQEDINDMIAQSGKDADDFIDYKEFVHRIINA